MIKLEKVEVMNIENAIRGARNPMNSWDKSDSVMCNGDSVCCQCRWQDTPKCKPDTYILGDNDLSLVKDYARLVQITVNSYAKFL